MEREDKTRMIRHLTVDDLAGLREIFFNSFSEEEAPVTYRVISQIVTDRVQPPSLCLGYDEGGELAGAISLSPVYFDDGPAISAYILAPLAVHEIHQGTGIATKLITRSKTDLIGMGVDLLFVYGDPDYYGRHGFEVDLAKRFIPPYPLEYEFGWQAVRLSSNDIGNTTHHFSCVDALSDASLW